MSSLIDVTEFSMANDLWSKKETNNTGQLGERSVEKKKSNMQDFISMFAVGVISLGAAIGVCYFMAQVLGHPGHHYIQ